MDGEPTMIVEEGAEEQEELERALSALQEALLLHPAAVQALFRSLVLEGRRFASTDEGAALREQLRRSALVARARVVFDSLTVRALDDDPRTVVPTAVLEALVKAASDVGREGLVEELFVRSLLGGAAR